jgi:drug/metabolite transporter (DMT)-like permease
MNHYRFLLRLSYWVAAIADFIIAVLVLIPQRMGVTDFVYPMGLMSAVAFSWGIMLVLADRKPLERRWVLAPTILVVFLLGSAVAYAGISGLIPAEQIMASTAAVVAVLGLLIYTWFKTRSIQN